MTYNKWDIVLLPFPFTDLSTTKKRPGLIISPDTYNECSDVMIIFITSKLNGVGKIGDYKIKNWKESKLPKPSMIRFKFATIDKSIIIKKLGSLQKYDTSKFNEQMISFFDLK